MDDEFAQDVSEFETLDEYKEDVRTTLLTKKEEATEYKATTGYGQDHRECYDGNPGSDGNNTGEHHDGGIRTETELSGTEHGTVLSVHREMNAALVEQLKPQALKTSRADWYWKQSSLQKILSLR